MIKQLHARGYFVILVDYLDNPPAKQYADIHEQVSTLDNEAVLNVAIQYSIELIISACVDQANITACYVAEKLSLPHPYSYELASNITDKGFMKLKMFENNIPTTKYKYFKADEDVTAQGLTYPLIVKPVDSCAASGVKKANNPEELAVYHQEAKRISRSGRTIVEEYFSGTEVSVYAFVENKEAKILMISERLSAIEGSNQVLKCYSTITPPNITEVAKQNIATITNQIARIFELDNTPLHVQFICSGDKVNVVEFAPRVGGGISYLTIRENTGFDIISSTIDSYLQKKVVVTTSNSHKFYLINIIYGLPSVFGRLCGIEQLMDEGFIDGVFYHKTSGSSISDEKASSGRIASLIVTGKSREQVIKKTAHVYEHIHALDINGKEILNKDLRIKE